MISNFELKTENINGIVIVRVRGELDALMAPKL